MISVNLRLEEKPGSMGAFIKNIAAKQGNSSYSAAVRRCVAIVMEQEKKKNGKDLPMFKI